MLAREIEVLARTLASLPMAAAVTNCNGVVQWVNARFSTLTEFGAEEIAGRDICSLDPTYVPGPVHGGLRHAVVSGESWEGECIWSRKDGRPYTVSTSVTPIKDGTGVSTHELWLITTRTRADETDPDQAEDAMEPLRTLFHNMRQGAALCTMLFDGDVPQDFVYNSVNAAFERLTGLNDVEGKRVSEVIPGIRESNPEAFTIYGRVARTGRSEAFEMEIESLGIWLSVSVYCPRAGQFIAVFENITERKLSEAMLRESAERHRTILHTAMDGFWLADMQGRLLEVNEAYGRMSGYSTEELLDMRISDLVADLTADATISRIQGLMVQGEARFDSRHRRKDGSVFDVEASVQYRSADGGRFVCFLRDITERKRAEENLRESREQLRLFAEHTPAPVAMFDRQMRYLAYNRRWTTDYGLGEQDLTGRSHYDVFPDIPERWKEIHRRCLSGAVEKCDEDPFPRANGELDWIRWEIHPWRTGKGEMGGIIIFSEIITARKRAEAQLMEAHKLESVGRLAGGIAHEFNNLLTVINGYSRFLLDRLNPADPLHSFAAAIRTSGERAAGLTQQLLAFGRKQVFRPAHVDVNTTVRALAEMLQPLIGENITLATKLDLSAGAVFADPDQLQQVLLNLVLNARDAMPKGGRIEIASANVEVDKEGSAAGDTDASPGRYVSIAVTDNGCGMDEKTRQQLFEPFFTTKEVGRGSGLGLAAVYGIVRQSGGWIDVRSTLGTGTTFNVFLPCASACPATPGRDIA